MALQIPDFLNARTSVPNYSAIGETLPNYLQGHSIAKAPARMAEEQKKIELANALSEIQNRYEEPKLQADIKHKDLVNQYYGSLTEAQIAHLRAQAEHQKSGGSLQGIARDWHDLQRLGQMYGTDSEVYKGALKDFQNKQAVQESLVGTRIQNQEYKNYAALGKDEQAEVTGKYRALGIEPGDGIELWNAKVKPELIYAYKQQNPDATNHQAVEAIVKMLQAQKGGQQQPGGAQQQQQPGFPQAQQPIAPPEFLQQPQEQGQEQAPMQAPQEMLQPQQEQQPLIPVDTRSIPIAPAMTASNRTDANNVRGALAEEQYIHKTITDAMAPYSKKYNGYSPKQFWDAGKKDDASVDKMAKFYAARALQPEIAGIRSRMAGGSNAAQALHDIQTDALNRIKIMDWRVSPEAYEKAQDYISKWMVGMTQARLDAMAGRINPGFQTAIKNASEGKNTVTRVYKGKTYNIPEHLVKQFDEDHK